MAERIVDVLVPLIIEEIVEIVKVVFQERISERIRSWTSMCQGLSNRLRDRTLQRAVEQILDVPVPEIATQLLEVPKIIPQDRILQRTVKQAETTQVLQSETSGADGQTYSWFQENSSAVLQTSTDLKGFEFVISVRRLAEQELSTALDQLASRISAIMKFGADADNDPSVKVKDLITDLISRLQAEASSETNQKSYCDEEMSKATEKREDLEADVAKHSSKLEAAVARSIDLDGEISTLQSANPQVQHVVNAVEVEKHIIREKSTRRPSGSRFHRYSSWTRPLTSLSWRRDRFHRFTSFRKPLRTQRASHSFGLLTKWSMSPLCWSCKLHRCRSLRRQLRSHSCRPLRKSLRPERPRRSRASRPLRVWCTSQAR